MHYHPQELDQWQKIEYLLAPDGIEDQKAIKSYLTKYALLSPGIQYHARPDPTVLGAVFKHGSLTAIEDAFVPFYKQFRLFEPLPNYNEDEHTVPDYVMFDDWLADMAASRPQDLEVLLRKVSVELGFTHQAMVLRDAKKWLPASDMLSYIPVDLPNKRPATLFKDFTATAKDLPFLVDVGATLVAQGPTDKHKALGDTLMRSCFFNCYAQGQDRRDELSRDSNAKAAFNLIAQYPLVDDFSTLLKQVTVRVKKPTVVWDALSYCAVTLESPSTTERDKARANAMVIDIIDKENPKGLRDRYYHNASQALGRVYQSSGDETTKLAILNFIETHMRSDSRFAANTIDPLARTSPLAFGALLDRLQVGQPMHVWNQVLALLATSVSIRPDCGFHVESAGAEASQFVFSRLAGPELLACLQAALDGVCSEQGNPTPVAELGELLRELSALQWTPAQRDTVRQSDWPATAVLLHLYLAGCSEESAGQEALSGALPSTQWQPLPFLRMLYPEHAPLWRSMELGILDMTVEKGQEAANSQQLMINLFDMFSKSFSDKGTDFQTSQKVIAGLGLLPLDFFLGCASKTPEPVFDLPEDMFSFS